MSWGWVILKVLTLLEWLIEQGQKNHWLNEGEQRAIAKQQAEIMRKTTHAQEALRDIERLTDQQLDDFLRSLEGHPANEGGSK